MKAGKIWGQTELIHANGVLEFHRIEYKKGVLVLFSYLNRPLYLVSTNAGFAWSKTGKFKDNANASINFIEKINYSKKGRYNLDHIKKKIETDSMRLFNKESARG